MLTIRSSDNTYISTGLRLAARYDVPKWEVFMEHLDWLFTDNKLVLFGRSFVKSTQQLPDRNYDKNASQCLKENIYHK